MTSNDITSTERSEPVSRRQMLKTCCAMAAVSVFACAEADPARAGYGNCYLCACPGFTGNDMVCSNCGHNYKDHW